MKLRAGTLLAAILSPILALAGLAYLGTFTRMHSDDFCRAASMNHLGFWVGILYWYNGWSGRFTSIVFSLLLSIAGSGGETVFPVVVITLWFLALSWALVPVFRQSHLPSPGWLGMAAAGLILLILFSTTPNLFQSVFWQPGQIAYTFPMIGLALLGGVILRAWLEPNWPSVVFILLSFFLAFISGGSSEVFDATQAALLILVLVLVLILAGKETRRRLVPVSGAAVVGALIALVIVVSAPGNQVRQAEIGHSGAGFLWIIPNSFSYAARIFGRYLLRNPGWALLSVLAPFLAGWALDPATPGSHSRLSLRYLWSQSWFRGLVLTPVSAFLLVAAACAPFVYAMNAFPEDRSILVPQCLLIMAAVLSSFLLAVGLHRLGFLPDPAERQSLSHLLTIAILAMIIIAASYSIFQTIRQAPNYQSYARSWDKRAAILLNARQQGQTEITVKRLGRRFGILDIAQDPTNWVNKCMADYYGFSAISGK